MGKLKNKLFTEDVPEAVREKICELTVLGYGAEMVSIMVGEQHENINIPPSHIREFLALNDNKLRNWRNKISKERAITRESLIRRATTLIARRLDQALEDQKLLAQYNEARAADTMTEDEYQRKSKVLYLPSSNEIIQLLNAFDKKMISPARAGLVDQSEEEPEEPVVDEERKAAIQAAVDNGDMIKAQELMYGAPIPSKE